jgi:hypothetical protein
MSGLCLVATSQKSPAEFESGVVKVRESGWALAALLASLIVVGAPIGCAEGEGPLAPQTDPEQLDAAAHSVRIDGVRHGAGYCEPQENCASCHGADLTGPADSCYRCHGELWNQPPCR